MESKINLSGDVPPAAPNSEVAPWTDSSQPSNSDEPKDVTKNEMGPPPPVDLSVRPMNDTTLPKPKLASAGSSRRVPKANPRLRPAVGVRKGFGMLDWMQLTNSAKDLAGRNGAPLRNITMDEVKQHNTQYDAWTVYNGKVYNITPYLHYHPGGLKILMSGAGRDCTSLFTKYHPWVNIDNMCGSLLVGFLDIEESRDADDDKESCGQAINDG